MTAPLKMPIGYSSRMSLIGLRRVLRMSGIRHASTAAAMILRATAPMTIQSIVQKWKVVAKSFGVMAMRSVAVI